MSWCRISTIKAIPDGNAIFKANDESISVQDPNASPENIAINGPYHLGHAKYDAFVNNVFVVGSRDSVGPFDYVCKHTMDSTFYKQLSVIAGSKERSFRSGRKIARQVDISSFLRRWL